MAKPTTGNISLDIKYIFLNFCQQFFKNQNKFKWTKDVKTTKLIIADKNSIDLGVTTRRPSIILNRGGFGWTFSVRGQRGIGSSVYGNKSFLGSAIPSADKSKNESFTDLLRGSVSLNVLSKNGIQAEEIANMLFTALTAYNDDLKKHGIHQITSLTYGEEQTVRATSEIEVAAVQINVAFLAKKDIRRGERLNNCVVYMNGIEQLESINFSVITNGTQIKFENAPPNGAALQITYADATTLNTIELANLGTGNGTTTIFTVPDSGTVYGYYKLLDEVLVNGPNLTSLTLTSGIANGGTETLSGLYVKVD
tara:strand:+ start:2576 stop:3505 length:930 start_codon:yes stop_codon:yes gene_type:complete